MARSGSRSWSYEKAGGSKFGKGGGFLNTLVRIVSSWFVAGVVVGVRAAPIVKYMRNWSLVRIMQYCETRGWGCKIL